MLAENVDYDWPVFLILELYSPYYGLIRISSAPLRAALTQLGN
jgi:hypothetical protein